MRKDMSDLTPRQRAQIMALEDLSDDQIDTTNIPETLDWSNAVRGMFYRPGEEHVGRAIGSTTDTSEKGLERLICEAMTGRPCDSPQGRMVRERPSSYGAGVDMRRPAGIRPRALRGLGPAFPIPPRYSADAAQSLDLGQDGPTRRRFLSRLQGEITKRGTIDVLRKGIKHGPHQFDPDVQHAVDGEREGPGPV